jgi:hypothetical protein
MTLNRYQLITLSVVLSNRIEDLRAHNANHPFKDDTPEHEAVRQADARYLIELEAVAAKLDAALGEQA